MYSKQCTRNILHIQYEMDKVSSHIESLSMYSSCKTSTILSSNEFRTKKISVVLSIFAFIIFFDKNSKDCFQWNVIATIKILVCSQSKIHFSWNWNSQFSNLLLDKCFRMRKFDFNWNSLNKYSTWTLIFNIQMTSCIFIWESFAFYRQIHF